MMSFLRRQLVVRQLLLESAREARDLTGKTIRAQISEMVRLRLGPGRLRATDYYMYGVYDDRRFPAGAKREVLSWSPQRLGAALNDRRWKAVCDDKLLSYALLAGLGLPFPEVRGVYDAEGRSFGAVPVLTSPHALAAFLREGMRYPFFAKPVQSSYGVGSSAVLACDVERDTLSLATGEELDVDTYVRSYVVAARGGYVFQELIRQHPALVRIAGDGVGSLRMIVLRGDDGPRLFRSVWRIPVGTNITDNFRHGSQGNLVAEVDRESGRVGMVVQAVTFDPAATASDRRRLGVAIEDHPDTGQRITGTTLPHWDRIVATSLTAAAALPGLRYQSWDVAIGPDGPLMLELNYRGGIDITQIPGTPGFYDEEFRAFWRRYAGS
jgi:hypothetical protein